MAANSDLKNCSSVITVGCTLMVWVIKLLLRPHFDFPLTVKFVLGIAPNFLDGFLLPFAITWLRNYETSFTLQVFRLVPTPGLCCLFILLFLVVAEYLQLPSISRHTFDYWDMAASAAGVSCAYWSGLISWLPHIRSYGQI